MAEDTKPPPQQNSFPPLPEPYVLPTQLLEKWLTLPPGNYIQANLTRNDIDQLFFALTRGFQAQQALHQCLVLLSNGNLEGANKHLDDARRQCVEGDNSARKFVASIMIGATNT